MKKHIYYFWLSNNEKYYERSYKRIQEVISNIGGINQVITTFAFILNKLYNNFIILSDTKNLLFSLIDSEQPHSSKRKKIRKSESLKIVKNNESMKHNSNLIKKSDLEKSINKFEKNIKFSLKSK